MPLALPQLLAIAIALVEALAHDRLSTLRPSNRPMLQPLLRRSSAPDGRILLNDRSRFSTVLAPPTLGAGAASPLESLRSTLRHCLLLVSGRSTFGLAHYCLLVFALTPVACSGALDASASGSVLLAPLSELSQVERSADPLSAHRPEVVDCDGLASWYLEAGLLEVDSGRCNYLSLSEPAAVAAPAGARVTMEVSHYDLTAAEPGEAHLALLVRNVVLWETTIPVPSDANVLKISVTLPIDVAKGDPVGFHLHNHGQNTYTFGKVLVSRDPTASDENR